MRKKEQLLDQNYLDRKPMRNPSLSWSKGEDGLVSLEVENKGFFNRMTQKFFKKPKISYIHLDKTGSFIWPLLDGTNDVFALGKAIDQEFGENGYPLYERLVKYISILESYGFILWNK